MKLTNFSQKCASSASNLGTYASCLGSFSKLKPPIEQIRRDQINENEGAC